MDNPQTKSQRVYVTRYALTSGVYRTNFFYSDLKHLIFVKNPQGAIVTLKIGKSVFFTEEEARKDFEKRKAKAIRSAKEKIQKVKDLQFSFKDV